MIERLTLHDFQVHRNLVLELDPHVTTIVGPTDAGKSAILRALRWVTLNQPRGTDFRRRDSEEVSSTLLVDGHKVTRRRGRKRNTYKLDGKTFAAFGADVPEAISSLLAMDELNFQRQIDPPFWFTESAPEVSRKLNQVVDLSLVDKTLGNLSKADRQARAELKISNERLERAEEEYRSLRRAKRVYREFEEIEAAERDLEREDSRARDLATLLSRLAVDRSTVEEGEQVLKGTEASLLEYERGAKKLHKMEKTIDHLSSLVREGESLDEDIIALQVQLYETEQGFKEEMGEACPLCGGEVK